MQTPEEARRTRWMVCLYAKTPVAFDVYVNCMVWDQISKWGWPVDGGVRVYE